MDTSESIAGMSLEGDNYVINANYLMDISVLNTIMRVINHSIDTVIDELNRK